MIGNAREQRAARHVGESRQFLLADVAFARELVAQIGDAGVFDPAAEIQQHAVGAEIGKLLGFEVLDRRKVAVFQQARPMVVGAHLHAPFVLADRGGRRQMSGNLVDRLVAVVLGERPVIAAHAVHREKPLPLHVSVPCGAT